MRRAGVLNFKPAKKAGTRHGQPRAGNAGIIATFAIALAGILVGALSAYLGERGASAVAMGTPSKLTADDLAIERARIEREEIIARIVAGEAPLERLTPPEARPTSAVTQADIRPKIIIIIDDVGVDRRASEKAIALPGPITFSVLPYSNQIEEIADAVQRAGGELMLHLPMEPKGNADPGPRALKVGMTGGDFIKDLEWNLSRFDGYVGVNNHMGSKLTEDAAAMKTLLSYLAHRNVFFLDSVTTSKTAVRLAAQDIGVKVYARDVFLDDEAGSETVVRDQLALAEKIARETGYVVVIGHPRKETLDVLGPWLTSAPARGLELVFARALKDMTGQKPPQAVALAPSIRM